MIEASIPIIIEGLKQVASTIRQIVIEEYRKNPIEKTLQ